LPTTHPALKSAGFFLCRFVKLGFKKAA